MKPILKKQSAFFNLRVLLASAFCLGWVFLALAQIGVFSAAAQSMIQGMTPEGCPPANHYDIIQIGGRIVPGTTDIGNHGDNVVTTIALPFSYTLYGQTFTQITLDSNGEAHFAGGGSVFTNACPLPQVGATLSAYPYWDDLSTDAQPGCSAYRGGTCGIYTSVTGIAPNRTFNIEWRTVYSRNTSRRAHFELVLYEGQSSFVVFYGQVARGNTSATAGVQKDDTSFDQYFCNGSGGSATGGQWYTLEVCPGQITLYARVYKEHGLQSLNLHWSGSTANAITIYRNGAVIATVPNEVVLYGDVIGRGTYTYWVCEAGTPNCSNLITFRLGDH